MIRAGLVRALLCWTLWGTVWGRYPEVWPERWTVLDTYASQSACTQGAWQAEAENPVLLQRHLEEETMQLVNVVRLSRGFACRPCAAEAPGPTGREE